MKKASLIFNLILVIYLLASCASSKQARTYKTSIDGNWQLQTVVTEGVVGKVKIQLFNEAAFNCFIGSNWTFNKNNSLGTYSISTNGNECTAIKRDIRWSIYEINHEPQLLQFKRLDNKYNSIDNGDGFRFSILQVDKNTMQLKSTISFENKPIAIIYNFVKL